MARRYAHRPSVVRIVVLQLTTITILLNAIPLCGHRVHRISAKIKLTHQSDEITLQKAQLILSRAEVGEESPSERSVPPASSANSDTATAVARRGGRHGAWSGWGFWNLCGKTEALVTNRTRER